MRNTHTLQKTYLFVVNWIMTFLLKFTEIPWTLWNTIWIALELSMPWAASIEVNTFNGRKHQKSNTIWSNIRSDFWYILFLCINSKSQLLLRISATKSPHKIGRKFMWTRIDVHVCIRIDSCHAVQCSHYAIFLISRLLHVKHLVLN